MVDQTYTLAGLIIQLAYLAMKLPNTKRPQMIMCKMAFA